MRGGGEEEERLWLLPNIIYISASGISSRVGSGGWLLHIPLYILELHITYFPTSVRVDDLGALLIVARRIAWDLCQLGMRLSLGTFGLAGTDIPLANTGLTLSGDC